MYTTSTACIACRREHPSANGRACLSVPHPHIMKGTPPANGVERWWIAPPPEAANRFADRLQLAEAMSAATWRERSESPAPVTLADLSACLENGFWHLTAWAEPAAPPVMTPYELLALRHHRHDAATRVFWLAAHQIVAHVFAIDLACEHHGASRGGDSGVAAAA